MSATKTNPIITVIIPFYGDQNECVVEAVESLYQSAFVTVQMILIDNASTAGAFEVLKAKFPEDSKNLTRKEVLDQLKMRDDLDTKREASPLKQAEDAFVIDTSDLSIDEIVLKILEYKDSIRSQLKKTTDS